MRKKVLSNLQRFSKALFLPTLMLPILGLLIAIANIFTNPRLIEAVPILDNPITFEFGNILSAALLPVLSHLSLIFCVGIVIGLARKKKAEAAFIAVIGFWVFIFALNKVLEMRGILTESQNLSVYGQTMMLGEQIHQIGVFPGLLLALITAGLHNRFIDTEFNNVFRIYGGSRFVIIILIPLVVFLAVLFSYVWPFFQEGINFITNLIHTSGNVGLFMYGSLDRLLLPSGLHHLVYTPFLYTSFGGVEEVAGTVYEGARTIYLAQLADPAVGLLSPTVNFDARGISKMFGLIGAGLAMLHTAKPQNKAQTRLVLLPAVFTALFSGVTEPIEFTFLFVSPLLFMVHSVLSGLSLVALNLFGSRAIAPNGLLDFILYNIPLGVEKTRWPVFVMVGVATFLIYYLIFRLLITKFNIKTIGRGEEVRLYSQNDYKEKQGLAGNVENTDASQSEFDIALLVEGLGGADNINTIDNCYTRLRLTVKNPALLKENILEQRINAKGVIQQDNHIQVVYGLEVTKVREDLDNYLGTTREE